MTIWKLEKIRKIQETIMSKVFVIPDVHLKTWMFKRATEFLQKGDYDIIIMLGDLVDDWDQELNLDLYQETFDTIYRFIDEHVDIDIKYCYGNHDVSYLFQAIESGYSHYARELVVEGINNLIQKLPPDNSAYIHRIDNVLFSHAGLTERFVRQCFGGRGHMEIDELIEQINKLGKRKIWGDYSPIWVRPQEGAFRLYPWDMMQVVGHTPVEAAQLDGKLLTLDTFSTFRNGQPIGDERFYWIDTETEEYHIVE